MSARLYLATPPRFEPLQFLPLLERVLDDGAVACIRLILESDDEAKWTEAATALLPVTSARDVALVVSDRVGLVRPLGLDGVHLSDSRMAVGDARKTLGPDHIVGAFAFTSRHRAMTLAEAGVDYVGLGPVRAGEDGSDSVDPELFEWWASVIETPVVAEGVTLEDLDGLAGLADFVMPGPSIWQADDPVGAVSAFAEVLAR